MIFSITEVLRDGSNSTCITTAESKSRLYRRWVTSPNSPQDLKELPVVVLGDHLQCGGLDGLKLYVNTAPSHGTDECGAEETVRVCDMMKEDHPTACKFLCPCPVHDGGCQAVLLLWNRHSLPSDQAPGKMCEVSFELWFLPQIIRQGSRKQDLLVSALALDLKVTKCLFHNNCIYFLPFAEQKIIWSKQICRQ